MSSHSLSTHSYSCDSNAQDHPCSTHGSPTTSEAWKEAANIAAFVVNPENHQEGERLVSDSASPCKRNMLPCATCQAKQKKVCSPSCLAVAKTHY